MPLSSVEIHFEYISILNHLWKHTKGFLLLPSVGEPKFDFGLQVVGQVESAHVLQHLVEQPAILGLAPGGRRDDVPHLTNQQRKHEHPHQPTDGHEHVLALVLRLGVLSDRRRRFCRKVKRAHVSENYKSCKKFLKKTNYSYTLPSPEMVQRLEPSPS